MSHRARRTSLIGVLIVVLIAGAALALLALSRAASRQPWAHLPGACGPSVEGAVFAYAPAGCGGGGTEFDSYQVYLPALIEDVASAGAPCPGIPDGGRCLRMWYVGNDAELVRRIGYAVSPDGVAWTRVPGSAGGGSSFGPGPAGRFDSQGVSAPTVIRDGATFKMWYTGLGAGGTIQGIGYATSSDGLRWTRHDGPLAGGAVLRASGVDGAFDRDEIPTSHVIKDLASPQAPCAGVPAGAACYRMWFEGVNTTSGYRYRIGYATSPDGIAWTRAPGDRADGAVLGPGLFGGYDAGDVGVPYVVKDGALYRMWYEAVTPSEAFSIGYATSRDGLRWERASPLAPAFHGADDPGSFDDDDVWTAAVLKSGASYRMWYTVSSKPSAQRVGLATMTPGSPISAVAIEDDAVSYTLAFTTTAAIPPGGSVLLTLPAGAAASAELTDGFGAGASLRDDPAAVTDAASRGVARAALVIDLPQGSPAGPKRVRLMLGAKPAAAATLLVQTFGAHEVLEYGAAELAAGKLP